jgi:pimeloyl-ACP methyl ester carboxylesterase
MTFVLVHGGSFAASCWDPMLPYVPASTVAVDLPGRGARPRPLVGITIADFVDAVVDEIQSRDLHDVVLVGHSMAGITMPGVAARLPDRLAHLVFVACTVPADGTRIVDTLDPALRAVAEQNAMRPEGGKLDDATASALFCNDMTPEQTAWTLGRMVNEANQITLEPVSLAGLKHPIPRTWIRTLHDLINPLERQAGFAERVEAELVDLDSAHMAMISHPAELAALLVPLAP